MNGNILQELRFVKLEIHRRTISKIMHFIFLLVLCVPNKKEPKFHLDLGNNVPGSLSKETTKNPVSRNTFSKKNMINMTEKIEKTCTMYLLLGVLIFLFCL